MIKVKYLEYTEVESVILHSGGHEISTGSVSWLDKTSCDILKLEIHEFDNGTLYIRATTLEHEDTLVRKLHRYASYRGNYTTVYKEEDSVG